ncbi:unnamed protein product [Vitrella brassicaformis CCMP3155]|uniref:2Fe-2S ferredoxin-type domain-containing protein n=1 Tax=Vitrella brassicaformis (strain CCMP3155) TaxID=1169540 RepID=A0A0G4G691_VITBC|nr:unnamed protein product [Vitrella brassicaformis CCMP3155]|mmetsp:Transcript_6231/g.15022  ORF Transcript_6231/g.15022 Transcript_6231/m.15022 type:complete len:159 (-) Transcript_6231:52-528(-)|eukprot:CEM23772.1 unnamed protein product [Vitrella brassicaformis CCMP3155]
MKLAVAVFVALIAACSAINPRFINRYVHRNAQPAFIATPGGCSQLCHMQPLKSHRRLPVQTELAHKVTLKTPEGDKEIECADDQYILDAAKEAGIEVPCSCRCVPAAGGVAGGESGLFKYVDNSIIHGPDAHLPKYPRAADWCLMCGNAVCVCFNERQ